MGGAVICRLYESASDQLAEIDLDSNRPAWTSEMFRTEFAQEHSHVFGARYGGQLVGFIVGHLCGQEVHIMNFAVRSASRRSGIGSELLQEALSTLFRLGARWASLEVRAGNLKAQNLYSKWGFQVAGRRAKYYTHDQEDALIMKADLNLFANCQ